MLVRGAPPGSVVEVRPFKKKRGEIHARRSRLVEAPPDAVLPPCSVFGLCGGCVLQELPISAQRQAKEEMVATLLGDLGDASFHPIQGPEEEYGYRNKVEISFGSSQYLSEERLARGDPIDGRFLGFHPPGRFDRIVDVPRCELVGDKTNAHLQRVREALPSSEFLPWNPRTHEGFWRHLVLRETTTGESLVAFYTAPPPEGAEAELAALAESLDATGVLWWVNDRVADAAIGEQRALLGGRPWIEERLSGLTLRLSITSFFQPNTRGAEMLYALVGEALGRGERLLDLYCGIGSIGLTLRDRFTEIVGVEINAHAAEDARANAERNGVSHYRTVCGPVEASTEGLEADAVVVDPPRAGLHPKAATWLAQLRATRLVYVACNPASLARDRAVLEEGGWRLTDLWTVDLFPQTGHVEAVALFVR